MGKLMNLVPSPRSIFRRKSSSSEDTLPKHITRSYGSLNDVASSQFTKRSIKEETTQVNNVTCENSKTYSEISTNRRTNIVETCESIDEKFFSMEKNFVFEQNNIIEKYEHEKKLMIEKSKEDRLRAKRAFENEKLELLKEIERKDKMLVELAKILKKEHEIASDQQKEEIIELLDDKINLFKKIGDKSKSMMKYIEKLIENNQNMEVNLDDFEELKTTFHVLSTLSASINDADVFRGYLTKKVCITKTELQMESMETNKKMMVEPKESISVKRELNYTEKSDDTDIQHELAQAYRKQKTELLKLFSTEKEEYIKRFEKEKEKFEKEVRTEYESRMAVERRAWQETIEDFEREITILKFERERMDRNYCLGMDELKAEFEIEKRSIHQSYSETQAEMRQSLEYKKSIQAFTEKLKHEFNS